VSAKTFSTWEGHVEHLGQIMDGFPDCRTGGNTSYSMKDIGLGAFSVFFTQSPSFLAQQKTLQQSKGKSNAQSLFHLDEIPSDNHIRDMLDPVRPQELYPCYDAVLESLGHTWETASMALVEKADSFGRKAAALRDCIAWDRQYGDFKDIINEIAAILDAKNVAWTQRVGTAIGRSLPTGQLAKFLGESVIHSLWSESAAT